MFISKMQLYFVAFISLLNLITAKLLNKVTLDITSEAYCLDGSRYGFYFSKGEGSGKNKYVFYL